MWQLVMIFYIFLMPLNALRSCEKYAEKLPSGGQVCEELQNCEQNFLPMHMVLLILLRALNLVKNITRCPNGI